MKQRVTRGGRLRGARAGMHALITAVALVLAQGTGLAAEGGMKLQPADINLANEASLQRGAKYFMNYCAGCHSTEYVRYSHIADGLGLTHDQVEQNLIFTGQGIGETVKVAMDEQYAEAAFGVVPPDLSLTARSRGTDWIYNYLKAFYPDPSRQVGVNNKVYPNSAMPHVLWNLQGEQRPVYEQVTTDGKSEKVFQGFEQVSEGLMSPGEYDRMVRDITAYMTYIAEPVRLERQRLGLWVMFYLAVFFVFAYFLKKEYWKDVH